MHPPFVCSLLAAKKSYGTSSYFPYVDSNSFPRYPKIHVALFPPPIIPPIIVGYIILYNSMCIYIYIYPLCIPIYLLAPKKSPWTQHQPIPFRQVCSGLRKPLIFEEIADQEVIDCPGLSPRRCGGMGGTAGTGGACCLDGLVKGLGTCQKDPRRSK